MTYSIKFTKSAKKEFDFLPVSLQDKVLDAVRILAINPFSEVLRVKKLKGAFSLYRLRVGDYRVVYEVHQSSLMILLIKIGHRREVYRRL